MYYFEYDSEKSTSNLEKHGIDFLMAQEFWNDPELIEAKADTEPRFLIIACIKIKHWSAVITYRSKYIRIISVRRSRISEVKLYEG